MQVWAIGNTGKVNIEAIQQALTDDKALERFPTEDLVRLTAQYPWFATAQLLLARKFRSENDHRYTDQVHQAAIHVTGQAVLYDLVQPRESAHRLVAKTTAPVPPAVPEAAEVTQATETPVVAAQPEIPAPSPYRPAPTTCVQPPPVKTAPALDPLQQEVLIEAIQSSISMEASGIEPAVPATTPAPEHNPETETDENLDAYSRWLAGRAQSLAYRNATSETPQTITTGATAEEKTAQNESSENPETPATSEKVESTDKQDDNSRLSHQRALVDRFIRFEPKITPGKADEYLTGNIARASIEEDPEIISETIADLYVKQGKIDRARKAYRKLMELYPEKSIYFAVRLKNLDKNKK
jgi:hypothetical protein